MLKKVEVERARACSGRSGRVALLFTGITGIIGSGWLFASLYAAQLAGPAAILSWLIGGGVALLLALVYAELGGMLPLAGAIARIPYFSHGAMSGFMAGWLCWIAYVATAPIEVTAVLQYASNYLPWLTTTIDGNRVLTSLRARRRRRAAARLRRHQPCRRALAARANVAVTSWKLAIPLLAATGLIVFGFDRTNFTDHGGFMPDRHRRRIRGGCRRRRRLLAVRLPHRHRHGGRGARSAAHRAARHDRRRRHQPHHLRAAADRLHRRGARGASRRRLEQARRERRRRAVRRLRHHPRAAGARRRALRRRHRLARRHRPRLYRRHGAHQLCPGRERPTAEHLHAPQRGAGAGVVDRHQFRHRLAMLLPFPGWSELIGFISSAAILSLAFGPVSLAALRHQLPDTRARSA